MPSIHGHSSLLAFSLNKQSAVGTAIVDANIQYMRPIEDQQLVTAAKSDVASDSGHFGKGHEFATYWDPLTESYTLPSATRPATDLEVLFAASQVMGAVATAQGNALGEPSTYQNTITFAPITTNPEVVYTTLVEELGGGSTPGWQKMLTGAWLNEFSLTGDMTQLVKLAWSAQARKYATSAITMPTAVTAASLFKTKWASLKFGPNPSSAIDAEVIGWNLNVTRNASVKNRAGAAAGEEILIHSAHNGARQVSFSLNVHLTDTLRDYFLNNTEVEVVLTLTSEDLLDSVAKYITITIPNMKIDQESMGAEEMTLTNELSASDQSILKVGANEPLTIVVSSGFDGTEVLVNA